MISIIYLCVCRAESTKIFVGGLSPDVGDKEFKDCFEKFGAITVIIISRPSLRERV